MGGLEISGLALVRENDRRYWDRFAASTIYPDDAPIVKVTWEEAFLYCWSKGGRLPMESEWIRAVRGDSFVDGPWPEEATPRGYANWKPKVRVSPNAYRFLTPVTKYSKGATWCGAMDMMGNASEFTSTPFLWSATKARQTRFRRRAADASLRREISYIGNDYVVMEVGFHLPILCAGWRGAIEPYHSLEIEEACRWSSIGFRCAYEWDDQYVPEPGHFL